MARNESTTALIEQLKVRLGLPQGRTRPPLTAEQFETQRRASIESLLLAAEGGRAISHIVAITLEKLYMEDFRSSVKCFSNIVLIISGRRNLGYW